MLGTAAEGKIQFLIIFQSTMLYQRNYGDCNTIFLFSVMLLLVVCKWFPFSVSLCLTSETYIGWTTAHKKVTTEQFAEPKSIKKMASSQSTLVEKPRCACFPPQRSSWQWAAVITKTELYLLMGVFRVPTVAFCWEKRRFDGAKCILMLITLLSKCHFKIKEQCMTVFFRFESWTCTGQFRTSEGPDVAPGQ